MLWLPNPTLGASVKNQILCFEKQNYCLSDSEFNFAETKIANFWQREHPVGDFSLVRFFWSSKEMNKKGKHGRGACVLSFFLRITNPNNTPARDYKSRATAYTTHHGNYQLSIVNHQLSINLKREI